MNLIIIPTIQSCSFLFCTDTEILKNIPLERSKTFSESIMLSDFWKDTQNIFFISGPASFTTLRNMSVFLSTLNTFSKYTQAENKTYHFYNIPTSIFLHQYIQKQTHSNVLFLYAIGKRETFIFHSNTSYTKIKNTEIEQYIQKNAPTQCIGFLSKNIIRILEKNTLPYTNLENNVTNLLNIKKLFTQKDTTFTTPIRNTNNTNTFDIDYGSLPNIG